MNKSIATLQGQATVVFEPRGDHGLEGFDLHDLISYDMVYAHPSYYRVWKEDWPKDYYETCGISTFNRYFKKI